MNISLSTSWNQPRHEDSPTEALREIRGLGFESVELYAHWLPSQVAEIKDALGGLGLRVSSLHGPCPVPVDSAGKRNYWSDWLAEIDEQKRRLAVDAHRRTVDLAAELGAAGVVVHLGNSGAKDLQSEIFEAIKRHGRESEAHRQLLAEAKAARKAAAGNGTREAAVRSARELGEHARGTGVKLGLECRDRFAEIPGLDDYPVIFEACTGLPVGYWHDIGHGEKQQNAGFLEGVEFLRRFGERLVGVHLHDTRLERDHQAPGLADTDFSILAAYLRPDTIRTMELSPRVEQQDILPGVAVLRRAGLLS